MKKWRNKILSAVLVLSLLLTSSSFAFAVGEGGADETSEIKIKNTDFTAIPSSAENSNNERHPISSAFDGNIESYWHTSWSSSDTSEATGLNKSVKIVFHEAKTISKIEYTPRQDDGSSGYSNGRFNNCIVYADKNLDGRIDVSDTSDDIVANVNFRNTQDMKEIVFEDPIKTNALLIYAKTSYGVDNNVNSHANAAEISIYEIVKGDYSIAQVGENKYTSLSEAINAADADNPVEILKDIELDTTLNISKNVTIKSVENSVFTIKRGSGLNVTMFTVATNGNLTLDNIIIDGGAKWSGDNDIVLGRGTTNNGKSASGPIINVLSNTTFTLGASAVLQNNASTNGGGAISFGSNSIVNIKGKIINNSIHVNNDLNGQSNGGAAVGQGTLNVSDNAEITGNYAYSRGGAFVIWNNGTLNITGNVRISNNKCDGNGDGVDRGGAAISIDSGTLNINSNSDNGNVLITKNTSNNKGGGAIAIKTGTININNGCTINNNTAPDGGAIYVAGGTANLNGATITGNTATTNGGAVYVNAGTLNVGQAGNDFALTISGNTATNGSGIYYGGNSSTILNINAKLNLSDEIYLHTNGMAFNVKCDLSGISPIKVASRRDKKEIANISDDVSNKSEALNIFINTSNNSRKSTYLSGSNITISDSTMVISEDLTSSTYYKGIENNLYTVTGANTYTWYEKGEDGSFRTVDMDTLSNGEHTVYCVASDGTNYMVSDVATVTVKDFVPCSKAIEKFKSI